MAQFLDEVHDLTPARRKDALLHVGQSGKVECRQFAQRVFQRVERALDRLGRFAEGGGALIGRRRRRALGIAHERLARGDVGRGAVAGKKCGRLARREGVALGDAAEAFLLAGAEGAEVQCRREREAAAVQTRRQLGSQPPRERQPPLDPERAAAEELRGGRHGDPVVVDEGGHHARLVHGAGGLSRTVRLQETSLAHDAVHRLDDDRDLRATVPPPPGQTLEAVEDLEAAVVIRRDAQRKRSQIAAIRPLAAQRRERRAEPIERHGDHGVASGSGKSWYSGYR
jgi:hypothetical protein